MDENPLRTLILIALELIRRFEEQTGITLPEGAMTWPLHTDGDPFPAAADGACLYPSRELGGIADLYRWLAEQRLGEVVFANDLSWTVHGVDAVLRDGRTGRCILCEAESTEPPIADTLRYLRRTRTKGRQLSWMWCWRSLADCAFTATTAPLFLRLLAPFLNGQVERLLVVTDLGHGMGGWTIDDARAEGRLWQDTTIRGQVERGTGILNNAICTGRLEWNRCSYVKDPETGKRVARPNPPEAWEVVEVPELRIVDAALWERVKARQASISFDIGRDDQGNALNRAHRRKFLLSGLLTCGCCGAGYTIMGKELYGCGGRRRKGNCANDRTISRFDIERRVLTGLKERLLAPELIQEFVDSFRAGIEAASASRDADRRTRERELAAVERKIAGILKAIEDGLYHESMKERLTALEADKARLLAAAEEPNGDLPSVLLHPQLSDLYRRKVEALEAALAGGEDSAEAMEMVRIMIDCVVLTPCPAGAGLDADLHGELAGVLAVCEGAAQMGKTQTHERPGSFEPGRFVIWLRGHATTEN